MPKVRDLRVCPACAGKATWGCETCLGEGIVPAEKCACGRPAWFVLPSGNTFCGKTECVGKQKRDPMKWLGLAAPSDRPSRKKKEEGDGLSAEEEAALYEYGWGMGGEDFRGAKQPGMHSHDKRYLN